MTGAPVRPRELAGVVVTVLAACGLAFTAVVALHADPIEVLAVAVLAIAAVGVVLLRTLEDLAVALLWLGVATSSWNAVSVGGLKPTHGLLAAATLLLVVLALATRTPVRVPSWVWVLGATITLVAVLTLVWPTSPGYFAARYVDDSNGLYDIPRMSSLGLAGLVEGAQWLVPAVALPIALCLLLPRRPRLATALADAWMLGAATSALVAVTDESGLTSISASLLAFTDIGGRQAGLSVQPNHVGVAIAIAMPLAVWRLVRGGRLARTVAGASLLAMAGGLVVSESRGGLVAAVLGAAAVLVADPRARRLLVPAGIVAMIGGVLAVIAVPGALYRVGVSLRLVGNQSAADSDTIRAAIGHQARADFLTSPWHGIGLEVAIQGHNIYLQLLAAGGVLLLAGFALAVLGALLTALNLRDVQDGLPRVLALCTVTWLVVGVVENQLTDVFLYIPYAIVAGLAAVPGDQQCVIADPHVQKSRIVAPPPARAAVLTEPEPAAVLEGSLR